MKKLLEIKGASKCVIVKGYFDCPLYSIEHGCSHPDGTKVMDPCTQAKCPLTDAIEAPADVWPDDENHRLGPNGERLVAVTIELGIKDVCGLCFYDCESGQEVERMKCIPRERKDGRNIRWELAGDRK